MKKSLEFNFGILALKLLGKNLYSNPITAISELVANGLDANANEIRIFIDMRNKEKSIIEIFDNGIGMSLLDIKQKYCWIGYKKRNDKYLEKEINPNKVMGRKGIGKLAALYLSNLYYIISKKEESDSFCYKVDIREYNDDFGEEKKAKMNLFDFSQIILVNNLENSKSSHGTIIRIEEINLKGFGDSGIEALKWKLANHFSLENLGNKKIKIKIVEKDEDLNKEYSEVRKNISFKNMLMIVSSYNKESAFYKKNIESLENKINFKPQKLKDNQYNIEDFKIDREFINFNDENNYKGKIIINNKPFDYELKGWLGIHSSIRGANFIFEEDKVYNKFYNPNQLRLYIRNKLAIENFLTKIKNTQAFANYIEGEIFFEILDQNDLNDITTSNRQDIDENDSRVVKLIEILKNLVNILISKRLKIANIIKEKEEEISLSIASNNKTELIKKAKNFNFNKSQIEFLNLELKGETIKDSARIFISHSKDNKSIVDFVYESLKYLGVTEDEIFYTSKNGQVYSNEKMENNIIEAMKDSIIDKDTFMLYFVTPSFLNRRFTLFESGAGWVTKSKNKYLIISNDLNKVKTDLEILYDKQYLYSYCNKEEFKQWSKVDLDKNIQDYNNFIVSFLNRCVNHLNDKRKIKNISLIKEIKPIEEWEQVDKEIISLWNKYFNEITYQQFTDLSKEMKLLEN